MVDRLLREKSDAEESVRVEKERVQQHTMLAQMSPNTRKRVEDQLGWSQSSEDEQAAAKRQAKEAVSELTPGTKGKVKEQLGLTDTP